MRLLDDLQAELAELQQRDLLRRRQIVTTAQGARITVAGRDYLNFASNDYLGLANHPALIAAAQQAVAEWGVGSGASHLVCGHQAPHEALEQAFARQQGRAAALLFGAGYLANLGVITALLGREDALFADRLNHASLNDAALLSRADFKRYPHNDLAALQRQLAASRARRKLIVVDAVFSMDGDTAPLADLLALAEQYDAWLYVDDAHGYGILGSGGAGSVAAAGLQSPRLIYMATLGKALGVAGALVAGEQLLIDYLLNKARPAIYTTASPAAWAATALQAMALLADDHRRQHLQALIGHFRRGAASLPWPLLPSATAIQPLLLADSGSALRLAAALRQRGVWLTAIRPPTSPTPRLRITLSAAHSLADVDALLAALRAASA